MQTLEILISGRVTLLQCILPLLLWQLLVRLFPLHFKCSSLKVNFTVISRVHFILVDV